jgi:3-phenylpropionate/trans-cinnamate dioxygenase ferredoxin reductase subunit
MRLSVEDINDPRFDLKAFVNPDVSVAHGAA